MNVYVCVTLYHVYITLLYLLADKTRIDNSVVIMNANNKLVFEQFKYIHEQLRKEGISSMIRLRLRIADFVGIERIKNAEQYIALKKIMDEKNEKEYMLFNFAWNNSYIYSTAGLLFKKCSNAIFVEESVLISRLDEEKKWKKFIHKLLGDCVDFYKSIKIKEIRVSKPESFPDCWKNKLVQLHIDQLVDQMSREDRKKIITIMSFEAEGILNREDLNDVGIVYTDPSSEDGIVSEEQKISDIEKICEFYRQYGRIILKLHPRDTGDYSGIRDITILPGMFPSELLSLQGNQFKFAVAISSSAVLTTNAEYKIIMNEKHFEDKTFKLKDIHGNIVE